MKKRIISLLLALVMLFSCMSLNIFAAEGGEGPGAEGATELTEAERYQKNGYGLPGNTNLSAEELAAAVGSDNIMVDTDFETLKGATEIGISGTAAEDFIKNFGGVAGIEVKNIVNGQGIEIYTDTEADNTYMKWSQPYTDELIQYNDPNKMLNANNYEQLKDTRLGASYVITFDFMNYARKTHNAQSDPGYFGTGGDGFFETMRSATGKNYATTWGSFNFKVDQQGFLNCYDAGTAQQWIKTDYQFTSNEDFVRISIWHTPRGLNGIREVENGKSVGDDNTYHVYVDGAYIGTYHAVKDAYISDNEITLADGSKAIVNGGSDYTMYSVRMGHYETTTALDNLRIYYGDFAECAHNWSYSHTHGENGNIAVTCVCSWCGKTEYNETETDSDLNAFVDTDFEILRDTTLNTDNWTFAGQPGLVLHNPQNGSHIELQQDADNVYLKWGMAGNYADNLFYNNENEKMLSASNYEQLKDLLGASYVISFDFMNYARKTSSTQIDAGYFGTGTDGLFETMRSQTGANYGITYASYNVRVDQDGYLSCYDSKTETWIKTDYQFKSNDDFVRISIWHTPRGLNGVREVEGGKSVGDDNTYHVFVDGEHVATHQAVKDKYVSDNSITLADSSTTTVNGGSDYLMYSVRIGKYDLTIALDNLKMYYGTIAECNHSEVEDGVCKHCNASVDKYCEICDRDISFAGKVLDYDAAVVGRNVELSDAINMNVYLELTEEIIALGASVVVGGVEKKLSELKNAEEEGYESAYKFTLPLTSIDMAKEIEVSLKDAEGNEFGKTYTTSIVDYLSARLADDDAAEEEIALIKAMLNYGAYAQLYFAEYEQVPEIADNLANAGLTEDEKNAVDAVDEAVLEDYRTSAEGDDAIVVTSAGLALASETRMRLYFTADAAPTVKLINGEDETTLAVLENGAEYYVEIVKANPAEFGDVNEVVISDGTNEVTVNVSVYSCLEELLAAPDGVFSENFENFAKAIYLYGEAAKAYVSAANE